MSALLDNGTVVSMVDAAGSHIDAATRPQESPSPWRACGCVVHPAR